MLDIEFFSKLFIPALDTQLNIIIEYHDLI